MTMPSGTRRSSIRIVISFCILCQAWAVLAQKTQTYTGQYLLGDTLPGEVAYEFYIDRRDTIKHGDFKFKTTHYSQDHENLFTGMELSGTYKNGKKSGAWTYRFVHFGLGQRPQLNEYDVTFKGSGREYVVAADFDKGKANGAWQAVRHTIADGRPEDTLFSAQGTFRNGVMNGTIDASGEQISLHGSINNEGLINGLWTFSYQNGRNDSVEEHRVYDNGILAKHFVTSNGDSVLLQHIGIDTARGENNGTWETITVNENYLQLIEITCKAQGDSLPASRDSTGFNVANTNAFLAQTLLAFTTHRDRAIWNMLNGADTVKLPTARVLKFEFSKTEQQAIKKVKVRFGEIQNLLNNFFDDPQVDISRHAYREIEYYAALMQIYQVKLNQLNPVVRTITSPAFEYINRQKILEHITPDLVYPDSVAFKFNDTTFRRRHAFPEMLQIDGGALVQVQSHLDEIHKSVSETSNKVEHILKKYKREKRLAGKEAMLINARDTVYALYNNAHARNDYNQHHARISKGLLKFYDAEFKAYAGLTLEEKISRLDALVNCFREALDLYDALADLPGKLNNLDEVYTRTVWNPYTFTNMNERVKKRLYSTFENVLLPFLFIDLQLSMECGNIAAKAGNFDVLYNRMLELRDQDTETLRKQLKSTPSVKETISLLDLKLNID